MSPHQFNFKVRVSEAFDADANGTYIHAGIHCGQPAYRLASKSSVFWICYDGANWCVWRQRDEKSVCHIGPCTEQARRAKTKLPTGHWYGAKKDIVCKLEYVCEEKAHFLHDGSDLTSLSRSIGIYQKIQIVCILCACLKI